MTIEEIAKLSAKIVEAKNKVAIIEEKISSLSVSKCFVGTLHLEIGHSRFTSKYYLSKEEILPVLERLLSQAKELLSKAIEEYEGSFEPKPIVDVSENLQQTTNVITTQNIVNDEL